MLPLGEDKQATLDVFQGKPTNFAHALYRFFPLFVSTVNLFAD